MIKDYQQLLTMKKHENGSSASTNHGQKNHKRQKTMPIYTVVDDQRSQISHSQFLNQQILEESEKRKQVSSIL